MGQGVDMHGGWSVNLMGGRCHIPGVLAMK